MLYDNCLFYARIGERERVQACPRSVLERAEAELSGPASTADASILSMERAALALVRSCLARLMDD